MIRTSIIAIVVLFLFSAAVTFGEAYTRHELEDKVAGFSRMQNAGIGLLTGGIVLDFIGPVLMANGIKRMIDDDDWDPYSNEQPDGYWTFYGGTYCTAFGIVMTVAGGVLTRIGRTKKREYNNRLKRISLHVSPNSAAVAFDF